MRLKLLLLFLSATSLTGFTQTTLDSLNRSLANTRTDLERYKAIRGLYNYYEEINRDSATKYATEGIKLAVANKKKLVEIHCLNNYGYQLTGLGFYSDALKALTRAFQLAEDPQTEEITDWPLFFDSTRNEKKLMLCYTHHIYAILMWQTQNISQEIFHLKEARRIATEIEFKPRMMMANMNLGRSYISINKNDSALLFEKEAEKLALESNFKKYLANVYAYMAIISDSKGDHEGSLQLFYKAIQLSREQGNWSALSNNIYYGISRHYIEQPNADSALYYSRLNLQIFLSLGNITGPVVNLGSIYNNIFQSFELKGNKDSAYYYQGFALRVKDSLYKLRIKSLADFQNVNFSEQLRLQQLEKEKVVYQNQVRTWFLLGGITVLLLLAIIFFRNNRQKQKANQRIEKAYADLKAAQAQLVHSEKMASLGELTAGIAHEIQNPLNFVNNFSEVNHELLGEMKEAIAKKDYGEVSILADDLISNEEKISYHGKRADAIVKSMLQHSRNNSGQKDLTDINALVDECLRLSFHGMRARDKSFNVKMDTSFQPDLPKVLIVSQDIGRVLLNLFTNAFYSLSQKKSIQPDGFEPVIKVKTEKQNGSILIYVRDNGNGIPQPVIDKIFQPFFTTKPTGEGTGLGLSMSFDIITKGHGGQLKVESEEGKYAAFTIIIPQ